MKKVIYQQRECFVCHGIGKLFRNPLIYNNKVYPVKTCPQCNGSGTIG